MVLPALNLSHEEFFLGLRIAYSFEEKGIILEGITWSAKCHVGENRRSGEKFHSHLLFVAWMIAFMNLSAHAVVAALLHDAIEHGKITREDILRRFGSFHGSIILAYVDALTEDKAKNLICYFQQITIASVSDWEIFVIKIVDRYHNILTPFCRDAKTELAYLDETLKDLYLMCLVCRQFVPLAKKNVVDECLAELINLAMSKRDRLLNRVA